MGPVTIRLALEHSVGNLREEGDAAEDVGGGGHPALLEAGTDRSALELSGPDRGAGPVAGADVVVAQGQAVPGLGDQRGVAIRRLGAAGAVVIRLEGTPGRIG